MDAAIVVTSINDGTILDAYADNILKYGHEKGVCLYAIPDLKTPAAFARACAKLRRRGVRCECPDVSVQDTFLRRVGVPVDWVPYNSDNRRNIGYLMALEVGAAAVISIDDDNYPLPESDFVGEHLRALGKYRGPVLTSKNGWFNICSLLEMDPAISVYPRGYPYFVRSVVAEVSTRSRPAEIGINAGLWLEEPDVDAITWLGVHPCAKTFRGGSVVLDEGTWTPVNTQNTALVRALVPSFYYIRMGYPVGGLVIDRYGDIMAGYFAQACAIHLGKQVRVGTPIAWHRRNRHDYMTDLQQELNAIMIMEDLLPWLQQVRLQGRNAVDAYASLSTQLDEMAETVKGRIWNRAARGFLHDTAYCMRQWLAACARVV